MNDPEKSDDYAHSGPSAAIYQLLFFCPLSCETMNDAPLTAAQELPRLIERMHRRYLDVVRIELSRHEVVDISPVQAMMLGTIGVEEISVRDLIERGYYLGSNASYNLKQLVDGGYVDRQASQRDRRSARLKLSAKGKQILDMLAKLNTQMAEGLAKTEGQDLASVIQTLRRLERRWSDAIRSESTGSNQDF